jgi:hypothetical protein
MRVGYGNYQWLAPGRRALRLGDAGDDVRFLQRHVGVEPDGYFGPQTAAALADFTQVTRRDATEASAGDALGVLVGRAVWSTILGSHSPLPRTRRRWRLGGDARLLRR